MDPRRVLTFRAVAHARSFSGAARELALTQPAVSQQVAGLERELGTRLLEREPGGLRLTPAGKVLLEHADAIAERFGLAELQLAEIAHGERVRLRIAAFPTALAGLVPEAVARLRAEHPGVEVTVEEGASGDIADLVRAGEVHLGVSFQDVARPRVEPEDVERRDIIRESFVVALPLDHALAAAATVRLADLAGDDWTAASTGGLIVTACRAAGFEPRLVSITRDQLAINALITRGLAVTLAPHLMLEGFRDVALVPIAGPAPERDVYALLPPGGRHPLAGDAFAALVAAARQLGSSPA